jgi:hypothetical protein
MEQLARGSPNAIRFNSEGPCDLIKPELPVLTLVFAWR